MDDALKSESILDEIRSRTYTEQSNPTDWGYDSLWNLNTKSMIYRVVDPEGETWSTHATEDDAKTAVFAMKAINAPAIRLMKPWVRPE